ncbi:MAG: tetratricopeptide repeat protein [Symploca sp. SIO2E9]|nr:tetratricopeptide repeat protein [Symploca sp. SIO2E9]
MEVNFPPDAELLVEALKSNSVSRDIEFVSLDFSAEEVRFIRDRIIEDLAKIKIEAEKKLVLMVRGLAKSIGFFGEAPPVLQDLNFVRDSYKSTVPHPILFVLPDYAINRLAKFAPDFWAWKSGLFRFKTPQATRDYAIEHTRNSTATIDPVATPEKQERIDLLHRLLMEYKPTGQQVAGENIQKYNNVLHQLGVAYLSQRNSVKARGYLEEVVKSVNGEISAFQAEVLNSLGETYYQQRKFEQALPYYQRSLSISQQLSDRRGETDSLFYLGNAYRRLRQFAKASDFYQQCLEIEKQIGARLSSAKTYHQLGMVAEHLRQFEQAQQYYQQALDICIEFEVRFESAKVYHCLGLLAKAQSNYPEAKTNLQKALEIYVEYQDEYWAAIAHQALEELSDI